jgi:DNA-binding transcriptional MerR regulator
MTIGQLSAITNLTTETLRYYESIKLLPKPKKMGNGYRVYTHDYIDKIKFIKNAKDLGFTLNEIKQLIHFKDCEDLHDLIVTKLERTEETIGYLKELDARLRKLLTICPISGELTDCPIVTQFLLKQ